MNSLLYSIRGFKVGDPAFTFDYESKGFDRSVWSKTEEEKPSVVDEPILIDPRPWSKNFEFNTDFKMRYYFPKSGQYYMDIRTNPESVSFDGQTMYFEGGKDNVYATTWRYNAEQTPSDDPEYSTSLTAQVLIDGDSYVGPITVGSKNELQNAVLRFRDIPYEIGYLTDGNDILRMANSGYVIQDPIGIFQGMQNCRTFVYTPSLSLSNVDILNKGSNINNAFSYAWDAASRTLTVSTKDGSTITEAYKAQLTKDHGSNITLNPQAQTSNDQPSLQAIRLEVTPEMSVNWSRMVLNNILPEDVNEFTYTFGEDQIVEGNSYMICFMACGVELPTEEASSTVSVLSMENTPQVLTLDLDTFRKSFGFSAYNKKI